MSNKRRKIDFSDINIETSYKNINLEDYKKYLFQKEKDYNNEIKKIKSLLKKTNEMIAKKCKEKNEKHIWIRERENCMYGSSFTLCENCRVDYYDSSYIHSPM